MASYLVAESLVSLPSSPLTNDRSASWTPWVVHCFSLKGLWLLPTMIYFSEIWFWGCPNGISDYSTVFDLIFCCSSMLQQNLSLYYSLKTWWAHTPTAIFLTVPFSERFFIPLSHSYAMFLFQGSPQFPVFSSIFAWPCQPKVCKVMSFPSLT